MKKTKTVLAAVAIVAAGSIAFVGCHTGHDHSGHAHESAAAKPYLLSKCLVSDEGFDHGKPYVFVHHGQEIKLCCEDCRKDFDKDPAKYLQKLSAAK